MEEELGALDSERGATPASEKENSRKSNKTSAELIIIGDDVAGDASSLQNSFKKFRHQKIREKNLMKACREAALGGGRAPEYKEALRMKFIETAKRYIGVPYGIKYKKEDEPVAPLYLDCCGLVRKVVQDLQEEFGFVIGKWNQAYQMDTLPIVLTESELKPGDLIFYEGTYNSNRSKSQKHNNVHVEIFLGGETGEGTIGSRYHSGRVSIFPSYKFTSTTWTLVKHHFRSLDTWLDGVCKSHCDEHPWHSDVLNYLEAAGKRSIFCDDCQDQDCNAGGDEDYDQQPGVVVTEEGAACAAAEAVAELHAPSADEQQEVINTEAEASEALKEDKPTQDASSKTLKKPKRVSSLSAAGNPAASSAANSAAAGAGAGASAASAKVSRSASKLGNSAGDATAASTASTKSGRTPTNAVSTASSSAAPPKEGPRCYYLGKTNGWKLVKAAMDRRGWTMMPTEYHFSTRYGFKWVERRNQIDYKAHIPGQLVCHIPNNDVITTKIGILCTLREKFCRQPGGGMIRQHPPWLPHTYDLESPADRAALLAEEERLASGAASSRRGRSKTLTSTPAAPSAATAASSKLLTSSCDLASNQDVEQEEEDDSADKEDGSDIKGGIWIYKPSCTNRGRGIRVIHGMESLKELCCGKPMGGSEETTLPYKGIVQKYIRNPLLVTPEGYKFDVRCYLLIARNFPTTLAFYHPGYCRLALKPYSIATAASLEDSCVHLTNAAIQKKDAIYKEGDNKELQIQTPEAIADNLDELGKADSAEFMRSELDRQIKLALVDVMKASNHILLKKHGYFDLLGCDFMLTATNKLHLLEINTNPSLTLDNSTLAAMLPNIVDSAIELVMLSQGPDRRATDNDDFLKGELPGRFSLIYDEGTGYMYKGARNKGKSTKLAKSASGTNNTAASAGTVDLVPPAAAAENA